MKQEEHHPLSVPLVGLSLLWLSLCTGLVYKHRELLVVFVCFCGSFLTANLWNKSPRQTKNLVGLVASSLSLWCLSLRNGDVGLRIQFTTLSIMAGYLAFDHWWSALYCQPPPKPILLVTEDALSLTVILIALVLANDEQLAQYTTYIAGWLLYRVLRFAHALTSNPVAPVQTTTAPKKRSQLWMIHGQAYDLQEYVDRHPGGKEAILLGQGRDDCTALFESYHPFTNNHRLVLEKYRVRAAKEVLASPPPPRDKFYEILCQRVAQKLKEEKIDPIHDRAASWGRTIYYWIISSCILVSGYAHCRGSVIGSFLFAVFGWLIGALGHDAGHFASSRSSWINDWGVWGMSLLCNPIQWQHQHTFAHHSFTNDFDHDPDVHHFTTLLRVHKRFQSHDIYKNQKNWLYVAFAYTMVVFGTCVWIPLGMIQEGSLYGVVEWTDKKRPLRAIGMYLHLLTYVSLIMILPFWMHASVWHAIAAVVLHVSTSGLIFAIFSQINHINEASIDETQREARWKNRDPSIRDSWAVAQIETSNNFCPTSTLWHFLSNGLNLQIEHHLFPGLNHCHLSKIAGTVEATCKEYGIEYKSYDGWSSLMNATLAWLDRLAIESPSH